MKECLGVRREAKFLLTHFLLPFGSRVLERREKREKIFLILTCLIQFLEEEGSKIPSRSLFAFPQSFSVRWEENLF